MKKLMTMIGVAGTLLLLCSCKSGASPAAGRQGAAPSHPYYTGDGGRGTSIAILAPRATGLAEGTDYIPTMVQGQFLSTFSGYSAISVLDRERLDEIYAERLSGHYGDDAGADLGHLAATDYVMIGTIIRTPTSYQLQIQVTKDADKMTVAYSGSCTFAELDNQTAVRRASLELLEKIGITPTERARTELAGAAAARDIGAQTALAQGITAQRRGGEVEALTYYYQAAAYDPSLLEAASRVSVLAANVSSGSIGADARNDVRWRNDWRARLDEANRFFTNYITNNAPLCEIVYSTSMESGRVNYSNDTMPWTFQVRLFTGWAYFSALEKSVQAVTDGLAATGRNGEWRLSWPGSFANSSKTVAYDVDFDLVNSAGRVIGSRRIRLDFGWRVSGGNKIEVSRPAPGTQTVTFNPKVDDITDVMTIRVRAVNGRDPAAANVRISAIRERPPADGDYVFDLLSGELWDIGRTVTAIPATIWGTPVTFIDIEYRHNDMGYRGNIRGRNLTSVAFPGSMATIPPGAFRSNSLSRLTIGYGVTTIGNMAFYANNLTSVIIPDSVTSIQNEAFNVNYLTSVTIGAGVNLGRWAIDMGSFGSDPFARIYNRNGKRAGTYTRVSIGRVMGPWKFTPR